MKEYGWHPLYLVLIFVAVVMACAVCAYVVSLIPGG